MISQRSLKWFQTEDIQRKRLEWRVQANLKSQPIFSAFVPSLSVSNFFHVQRSSDGQIKCISKTADEEYGDDDDDDEHSETLCGTCAGTYSADEFWIACDVCERWFHGKCVKITPAKAESIKQYKCPSCS